MNSMDVKRRLDTLEGQHAEPVRYFVQIDDDEPLPPGFENATVVDIGGPLDAAAENIRAVSTSENVQ